MRVVSGEPLYWKARNLDTFNGFAWEITRRTPGRTVSTSRGKPTSPRTGRTALLGRRGRGLSQADPTTDVIGAGTTRSGATRRAPSGRASPPAPGTRRAGSAATTPTGRGVRPEAGGQGSRGHRRDRTPERVAGGDGAVQAGARAHPDRRGRLRQLAPGQRGTDAEFAHFRSVGRDDRGVPAAAASAARPVGRRGHQRAPSTAHVGERQAAQERRTNTRWTSSARSTTTCTGPSSATPSAPRHAHRRGPARLLHQRVPPRLLPALRGRDGADAADGRHLGARRNRLLARRLLARATRPGSSATPTPTPGSRCGSTSTAGSPSTPHLPATPARSRVARSIAAAPAAATTASDSGDDTGRRGADDGANPQAVRPDLQVGRTDRQTTARHGRAAGAGSCGSRRSSPASALVISVVLLSSAARAAPPRWTARSTRSRTPCGASAAP